MIVWEVRVPVKAWTPSLDHERVLGQLVLEDDADAMAAARAAYPDDADYLAVVPIEAFGPGGKSWRIEKA